MLTACTAAGFFGAFRRGSCQAEPLSARWQFFFVKAKLPACQKNDEGDIVPLRNNMLIKNSEDLSNSGPRKNERGGGPRAPKEPWLQAGLLTEKTEDVENFQERRAWLGRFVVVSVSDDGVGAG